MTHESSSNPDPIPPTGSAQTNASPPIQPPVSPAPPLGRIAAQSVPPQQIVIQQKGGTLWKMMAWVGWVGLLFCIPTIFGLSAAFKDYFDLTEGIQEKFFSGARHGADKVAIIAIEGVIMEADGFVKNQIERVRKDKAVKAIVLRVDSPGGSVTASDYLLHHLKKLCDEREIPLVVSMGGMAASGGYYVSMAVGDTDDSIFAEPTTTTGSIGVIIPHYNISGLLEKYEISDDSIVSHPRKQLLSMTRPPSEEDREILQGYVNHSFNRFKKIIQDGRPYFQENEKALIELATGEIFTADQAVESKLVDRIGYIEDAVDRVAELAELEKETYRVVKYHKPASLLESLEVSQMRSAPLHERLFELASPRAYYLSTSLPVLLRSS